MTNQDFLEGQIILLDKPLDWTSFQAVNKLKYKLKNEFNLPKKFKIGHAGTLDPRATGLLIVCTGKFTKKIQEIQDAPKEYLTEIRSLNDFIGKVLEDKKTMESQRDGLLAEVKRLNAQTAELKAAIRDRCGEKGRDWHQRLEQRAQANRLRRAK